MREIKKIKSKQKKYVIIHKTNNFKHKVIIKNRKTKTYSGEPTTSYLKAKALNF